MPSNNGSRRERQSRKSAVAFGIVQIRQGAIRGRLVDPARHPVQNLLPDGRSCNGGRLKLPVGFGVKVARVERQAVLLHDDGVVRGLVCVDVVGDEVAVRRGDGLYATDWVLVGREEVWGGV